MKVIKSWGYFRGSEIQELGKEKTAGSKIIPEFQRVIIKGEETSGVGNIRVHFHVIVALFWDLGVLTIWMASL